MIIIIHYDRYKDEFLLYDVYRNNMPMSILIRGSLTTYYIYYNTFVTSHFISNNNDDQI